MNVFDDKHDFIRETHKPFTPLPTIYEERTTKQKWRPTSIISEVSIEHHMSSTTKRHFKNRHDDSSTKSTAAQNSNRHLEYAESTSPHQNTPPKLTHQILSERKTPYKVYGDTRVRIPLSTPKSNADDDYINMKITSHAIKEGRRMNKRQSNFTSFRARKRETPKEWVERQQKEIYKQHHNKPFEKIDNPSQYTPSKSTHQILSAREIPYTGYDDTRKWIPLSSPKSNEDDDYINMNMISHSGLASLSPSGGSSLLQHPSSKKSNSFKSNATGGTYSSVSSCSHLSTSLSLPSPYTSKDDADHHTTTMPDPISDISCPIPVPSIPISALEVTTPIASPCSLLPMSSLSPSIFKDDDNYNPTPIMPDSISDVLSSSIQVPTVPASALEDAINFFTNFIIDTSFSLAKEQAPLPNNQTNTLHSEQQCNLSYCATKHHPQVVLSAQQATSPSKVTDHNCHASSASSLRTATLLQNTIMVVVLMTSSAPDYLFPNPSLPLPPPQPGEAPGTCIHHPSPRFPNDPPPIPLPPHPG